MCLCSYFTAEKLISLVAISSPTVLHTFAVHFVMYGAVFKHARDILYVPVIFEMDPWKL